MFFFHNVPIKSIQFVRGSLLQLPNLLNQRNVEKGVTGCFNTTISFFELIHCHIIVAALHFLAQKGLMIHQPSIHFLLTWNTEKQWRVFSDILGQLIDCYVIVNKFADLHSQPANPRSVMSSLLTLSDNAHAFRISMEHCYFGLPARQILKRRSLPTWLRVQSSHPQPSHAVMQASPDGVFNYASAVLNDGLLLMEFRDAIHEGHDERILWCWKFMLPYFLQMVTQSMPLRRSICRRIAASPRIAHQMMCSRKARPEHTHRFTCGTSQCLKEWSWGQHNRKHSCSWCSRVTQDSIHHTKDRL